MEKSSGRSREGGGVVRINGSYLRIGIHIERSGLIRKWSQGDALAMREQKTRDERRRDRDAQERLSVLILNAHRIPLFHYINSTIECKLFIRRTRSSPISAGPKGSRVPRSIEQSAL